MEWLTVSETYELVSAVLDGLVREELELPGGGPIRAMWFSWRAGERRLVKQRSWHECAAMYERIRPFLECALAEVEEGGDLDLSFIETLYRGVTVEDQEDVKDEGQGEGLAQELVDQHEQENPKFDNDNVAEGMDVVRRDNHDAEDPIRRAKVKLLKSGLILCNASIERHGGESNQLLSRRELPAKLHDDYAAARLLGSRFGVTATRSAILMKEGESLAGLRESLLLALEQLGVGELELAESNDESRDEIVSKTRLDPTLLERSLALCEMSIEKFGAEANKLSRAKDQTSLSAIQFSAVIRFLRAEFGVSSVWRSNALTQEGETLADLRKALLVKIELSNAPIPESEERRGVEMEWMKGTLQWCEASIERNGEQSNLLLGRNRWPEAKNFVPIVKAYFGVKTSKGAGPQKGIRTKDGTTLTDLRRALLANPDISILQQEAALLPADPKEILQMKGALQWCEASIRANGEQSDKFVAQLQFHGAQKFGLILKARFGVYTGGGSGPQSGTRTRKGTTLRDLQRALLATIGNPLESNNSVKRLKTDDNEEDPEINSLSEASDSGKRQKLLKFDSDATGNATAANDSPDEVEERLVTRKPVRSKRARSSD